MFGNRKAKKEVEKMLEKGHDMTIGEILKITEAIDSRLKDMGLCSHQVGAIGNFLAQANSMGDLPDAIGGMVSGDDMKEILEKIAEKMNKDED